MRENTSEILSLANYKVITAENGKTGVELAQKEKPDLIICDIMMPELDGYGVLHILSKKPETASIPFIFLTAKTEKSDIRKGMTLGADDYLTKPFDDTDLLNAVESRLNRISLFKNNTNPQPKDWTNSSMTRVRPSSFRTCVKTERCGNSRRRPPYLWKVNNPTPSISFRKET